MTFSRIDLRFVTTAIVKSFFGRHAHRVQEKPTKNSLLSAHDPKDSKNVRLVGVEALGSTPIGNIHTHTHTLSFMYID